MVSFGDVDTIIVSYYLLTCKYDARYNLVMLYFFIFLQVVLFLLGVIAGIAIRKKAELACDCTCEHCQKCERYKPYSLQAFND